VQGGRETTASTRYLAALGFSLGCHAALLLALTLFPPVRIPLANERALVVAIIDDAGAGDANGGAGKADADTSGGARDSAGHPPAPDLRDKDHCAERVQADDPRCPEWRNSGARVDVPSSHAEVPPAAASVRAHRRHPSTRVAGADRARRALQDAAMRDAASAVDGVAESADRSAANATTDAGALTSRDALPADGAAVSGVDGGVGGGRVTSDVAGVTGAVAGGGRGAASGAGAGGGDLRPWCTLCPTPVYPTRARREGWQGTVDVDLRVGRDGEVEQASVGRSSGFAVLDAAAVTVARQSRFRVIDGAERRGQLRYRFVLEGSADRPL